MMNGILEARHAEISSLCRQIHVLRLDLFGSAPRGSDFSDQSDFDFLVVHEPTRSPPALNEFFAFRDALAALVGRRASTLLYRLLLGLLVVFAMIGSAHGVAKAQEQDTNILSFRCDIKQDQIILSYDDPLPNDKLGVNSWNMDSLWGPGSNENLRVRRAVTKRCNLSSGTFEVKISPNGSEDVQLDCGANPSTAHADIYFEGHFLFGSDFNDSPCDTDDNNLGIDQIRVNGRTGTVTISYGQDLF